VNSLQVGKLPLLYYAASVGNIPAIRMPANLTQTGSGSTPLHIACWNGKIVAARLLLQLGADPTRKNRHGDTPLADANAKGFSTIASLLQSPCLNIPDITQNPKSFQHHEIPKVEINPGGTKSIRIVCLSDSHARFKDWAKKPIPDGDILIHSGDISNTGQDSEYDHFNKFISGLPHKHKILVFGNHDEHVEQKTPQQIAAQFPHVTVLQDKQIVVEGIKIYGAPYTGHHMAWHISHDSEEMRKAFDFPSDTDILVTHVPPQLVSDLAWVKMSASENALQEKYPCVLCSKHHPQYYHWGSRQLLEQVYHKKPKVHQFGHVHDSPRTMLLNGTLFLNAALDLSSTVRCFDCLV